MDHVLSWHGKIVKLCKYQCLNIIQNGLGWFHRVQEGLWFH